MPYLSGKVAIVTNAQSPLFVGRVVARVSIDPQLMDKSGNVFTIAALADEFSLAV